MNGALYLFLPSRIRGVYRYNQKLADVKDDHDAEIFVETKLRFLPEDQYRNVFMKYLVHRKDTRKSVEEGLLLGKEFQGSAREKYEHYFKQYSCFANHCRGRDGRGDNFLEAQFVKKVLAPILSVRGLLQVRSQKDICGYTVDFTVEGEKRYAFEIDGFGKFVTRDDLDYFLRRQNDITNEGWTIYRFSYSDIQGKKSVVGMTKKFVYDIFYQDTLLVGYLEHSPQASLYNNLNLCGSMDPVGLVNDFFRIQDSFARLLEQNHNIDEIIVKDGLDYPFPLVALSLSDLYHFFEEIEKVLEVAFVLPNVHVVTERSWEEDCGRYFDKRIRVGPFSHGDAVACIINKEGLAFSRSSEHALEHDQLKIGFREYLGPEEIHGFLLYITQAIFRYEDGTKKFQDNVLQFVFNKKDVLGIFPTGSGKSFCFWFPALLKPGLALVICPLKSLMRDQIMTLEAMGIASAAFINSDIDKSQQKGILHDAKMGNIKILYVAPERIRIRDFVEMFDEVQEFVPVNYLVIDEAHCISEWGHDFRPSYLNIPQFYQSLKAKNPGVQIIALTATAGQMVEKDIMNILKLQTDNVPPSEDLDRIRFSYQVVAVDGYEDKRKKFKEVINDWVPEALRKRSIEDVLQTKNRREQKGAGLVYVIYADPHGRKSINDGIAHYLYETKKLIEPEFFASRDPKTFDPNKDYSEGRVRPFSSKIPTLCPICFSHRYTSDQGDSLQLSLPLFSKDEEDEVDYGEDITGIPIAKAKKGQKKCENCGHIFTVDDNNAGAVTPTAYPKSTRQNQYDFKRGKCDILVATKGFGMGIDKENVRFAVHTSFASGIESWYQEAGRAGRDEERAHIVILSDIPTMKCINQLWKMEGAKIPECSQTRCPHGKRALCDYGKQHLMIKKSYPSVEADAISCIKRLDKLITSFHEQPLYENYENKIVFQSKNDALSKDELALFRLKLLGIVKEFSVYYSGRQPNIEVIIHTEPTDDGKITIRTKNEEIQRNLAAYLNSNRLYKEDQAEVRDGKLWRIGQKRDIIQQCKERYDQGITQRLARAVLKNYSKYEGYYNRLTDYLLVILDHTYSEVLRMRYQMLWILLDIIRGRECRRTMILPYFNTRDPDKKYKYEGYKCELCDNCVPNLYFTRTERVPPPDTDQPEELRKELKDAFEGDIFEYEKLVRLRDAFREYPGDMRRRAQSILSGKPDNMVALYFLREFAKPEEKESSTKFLIRQANRFLTFQDVVKLFESSEKGFKGDLIVILDDEDGRFNSPEGIRWLYDNARRYAQKGDERVKRIKEKFGFYLFCADLGERYGNSIKDIKQRIGKAYYGRDN